VDLHFRDAMVANVRFAVGIQIEAYVHVLPSPIGFRFLASSFVRWIISLISTE
jgi:hypothetical protein